MLGRSSWHVGHSARISDSYAHYIYYSIMACYRAFTQLGFNLSHSRMTQVEFNNKFDPMASIGFNLLAHRDHIIHLYEILCFLIYHLFTCLLQHCNINVLHCLIHIRIKMSFLLLFLLERMLILMNII